MLLLAQFFHSTDLLLEPKMPKLRFTSQLVKTAICPKGNRKILFFDTDCKGLMLEVRATTTATYYLRYQSKQGKTQLLKIGDSRDISLAQARQLADKLRNQIAMGIDPKREANAAKKPRVAEKETAATAATESSAIVLAPDNRHCHIRLPL